MRNYKPFHTDTVSYNSESVSMLVAVNIM